MPKKTKKRKINIGNLLAELYQFCGAVIVPDEPQISGWSHRQRIRLLDKICDAMEQVENEQQTR